MSINHQQQQQLLHPSHHGRNARSGRMKDSVSAGGEIVEVEGGHIIRSIDRKDRHSKVCTAKGPRDRRVRLSAQTAIQFYDVQDRLGYDRPSKALDWLIKKAKAAIDELAELPPWHPTTTNDQFHVQMEDSGEKIPAGRVDSVESPSSEFAFGGSTSFTPPSGFFFPIASSIAGHGGGNEITNPAAASSSVTTTGFHQYPPEILSRSKGAQTQDLRLSLQYFQDPTFLHQQPHPQQQSLLLASDQSTLSWPDHSQRILHSSSDGSNGSYMSNQMLGQRSHFYTQRGPLQSNISPSFLPWLDPAAAEMASGGLSEFRIPARIQGEEEHNDSNASEHQSPWLPADDAVESEDNSPPDRHCRRQFR